MRRNNKSLLNCADKLLDLLEITIKQADALNSWLRVFTKLANEHEQVSEKMLATFGVLSKRKRSKSNAPKQLTP